MVDIEKVKGEFEGMYSKKGKAVWTKEAPEELRAVIERIEPCKAIDMGCGEGLYTLYLDSEGFNVCGVDLSGRAISYAKQNAKAAGRDINFYQMNLLDGLSGLEERFGFALEWGIMHSIPFEDRARHVENVAGILNSGAKYLSVCFNINSPEFGGVGLKVRETPDGATLYYSSRKELEKLFGAHFKILEQKDIVLRGNIPEVEHMANLFLLEKK